MINEKKKWKKNEIIIIINRLKNNFPNIKKIDDTELVDNFKINCFEQGRMRNRTNS